MTSLFCVIFYCWFLKGQSPPHLCIGGEAFGVGVEGEVNGGKGDVSHKTGANSTIQIRHSKITDYHEGV